MATRRLFKTRGAKPWSKLLLLLAVAALLPSAAHGQTLIGSPFITDYDGWTDTYDYGVVPDQKNYPAWGVLLEKGVLMENSNGAELQGGTANGGIQNDGLYEPYKMVNSVVTASTYTLTGALSTTDDDGMGIVFGYQDEDNYFRLSSRRQGTGSYGFSQGLTVSKVVNGVITPYLAGPTAKFIHLMNDKPLSFKIKVDGDDFEVYAWREAGREPSTPQLSGSDSDLAPGQYGVMSWGMRAYNANYSAFGTQLHSMTLDNGSDGTLEQNHTFDDASPIAWRTLAMTNANGDQEATKRDKGAFRLDFRDGGIHDDTNGNQAATDNGHVDFMGPAIVVDEASAQSIGDMEMKVRITCDDNEGPGLLFRVQDDSTFYRLNFTSEETANGRPWQGMSIQKCDGRGSGDPVWTELYHDTNTPLLFNYTPGDATASYPFDVKLTVTEDSGSAKIDVEVDYMDGSTPETVVYPSIYDDTDPLLTGTVGFTNWGGSADGTPHGVGVMFSGYGGDPDAPLVIGIGSEGEATATPAPEPGSLVILLGAVFASILFRRHK